VPGLATLNTCSSLGDDPKFARSEIDAEVAVIEDDVVPIGIQPADKAGKWFRFWQP